MREAVLAVCVVSAAKCLIGQMAGGTKMKGQLRFMLDMLLAIVLVTPFAEGIVHFELPEVSSYELTDDYAADLRNRALAEEAAENISGVLMQQITAAGLICILPALTHEIFFIAPPLIVGFAEMSKPSSKLREKAPVTVGLIALAAAVGCASRYVICVTLGLPLTIAAVLSCGAILIAVNTAKLYFPPCGAAATLPFIIPEAALLKFPVELIAGYVVLTAAVFLFFGERPLAPVRKIAAIIRR